MTVRELIEQLKAMPNLDAEVKFLNVYGDMTEETEDTVTGLIFSNSGVTLTNENNA